MRFHGKNYKKGEKKFEISRKITKKRKMRDFTQKLQRYVRFHVKITKTDSKQRDVFEISRKKK